MTKAKTKTMTMTMTMTIYPELLLEEIWSAGMSGSKGSNGQIQIQIQAFDKYKYKYKDEKGRAGMPAAQRDYLNGQ